VFKNPALPAPPGWTRPWTAGSVLEAAGLKGTRIGGAEISPMHANYFVNTGDATAADVQALITRARDEVRKRFGIELETEVKLVGAQGI
jgi:UDP-N-acetylmuramate dehydrogenase